MKYLKHFIITISLCVTFSFGHTQDTSIVRVQTMRYSGYIFPGSEAFFIPDGFDLVRWFPAKGDIRITEKIIRGYLKGSSLKKQLKWLRLYKRQYVGYLNSSGERIIWVNFICCWRFKKQMSKETSITLDGGNCYWDIRVNLDKEETFGLVINGTS